MKKTLYVDMDGTLFKYKKFKSIEQFNEKGYFLSLQPEPVVLNGVKMLSEIYDVCILSKVLSENEVSEKNKLLNMYNIPTSKRIFVTGSKAIVSKGFLLDDYTKNLDEWEKIYGPGTGIKFYNGINGTNGSWQGASVSYNQKTDIFVANVIAAINGYRMETKPTKVKLGDEIFDMELVKRTISEYFPKESLKNFTYYENENLDKLLMILKGGKKYA